MLVSLHERLLQHIFGVFAVLRDMLRQAENPAFIPTHQFGKSASIAFARLSEKNAFVGSGLAGNGHERAINS